MSSTEGFNTIVIGGGQAGLAAGYYLKQRGNNFFILDENARIGETWRNRWDSLRLFTPSQNDNLPGMKFPKPDFYFPTKDEAAEYLEVYARQLKLPIQHGFKVDGLQRNENGFRLTAGDSSYHARNVIVATGAFRTPYTPAITKELDPGIFQMHSADYRKPADVVGQNILVVGAGNSGSEIALELTKAGRKVWLAGRDVGRIPADRLGRILGGRPFWWFMRRVMTIRTPVGRRMKSALSSHGDPLIRARREEVAEAGVEFTPRLMGAMDGKPQLEGGRILPAESVIWATGFHPDYRWINLPVFDETGRPRHERGVVHDAPGLFFIGLRFQTGLTSSLMGGVGEDAKYITDQIVNQ
jgi:putative flavoprotein involved in K+ transport